MARNFQIRYLTAGRIVRLHFIGKAGLAERIQAAEQVAAKFGHLRELRLLVDTRFVETSLTPDEQRQFADFVRRHALLRRAKTAVLCNPGITPVALIAQKLAKRGNNTRIFLVESAALQWLRSRRLPAQ